MEFLLYRSIGNQWPVGLQPSEEQEDRRRYQRALGYKRRYRLNDLNLMGEGDVLLLYTDGLLDPDTEYTKARLERAISNARNGSARDICQAIIDDRGVDARIADDLSVVVIKYHCPALPTPARNPSIHDILTMSGGQEGSRDPSGRGESPHRGTARELVPAAAGTGTTL